MGKHSTNKFRVETPADKTPTRDQRNDFDDFVRFAVDRLHGKSEAEIDNTMSRIERDDVFKNSVGPILAGLFRKKVLGELQKKQDR